MFSEVDGIIFPDSCEVIQVTPQHFVYPIFKCGRSSLVTSMKNKGWQFVPEQDINKIQTPITVFLRDPQERFLSGVNTFLQHLESEGNGLDEHTVLYFVNRYLFLNRHFAPQFFWLLNLARFSRNDTLVTFRSMEEISQLTDRHSHAGIDPLADKLKQKIDAFDWSKLEVYYYLDQILLDLVGKTITLHELFELIKQHHSELYELVFKKTLDIVNVLPKT